MYEEKYFFSANEICEQAGVLANKAENLSLTSGIH